MNIDTSIEERAVMSVVATGLSRKKLKAVIAACGTIARMYWNFSDFEEEVVKIVGQDGFNEIYTALSDEMTNKVAKELDRKGIIAIPYNSEMYPDRLKNIDDAPLILYAKGNTALLKEELLIGVVGTRRPSRYGRETAESFVYSLCENGLITVSGLAYGIDSVVATTSLKVNGKTIAVLGGGLDEIYPASNTNLAEEILKNDGLLLSEYQPSERPTQYTFPERNRIISGISKGVLIVEAGEKSGSLITANFAIEQGKDIFIVPANVNSIQSVGSNSLLYQMPHCMVISPDNILEEWGINKTSNEANRNLQLTIEEQMVYDFLMDDEQHFDDILEYTKLKPNELSSLLTEMEMMGIIKKTSGNYYGI
ncbi:MAG: DNA-processing protein DprA [Christensenellales bacterium]